MKNKSLLGLTLTALLLAVSCKEANTTNHYQEEKEAILATLNNETKNAFQRDYEAWTQNWAGQTHHKNPQNIINPQFFV